jgi:imidazolonepropionase-like amidohydrolase
VTEETTAFADARIFDGVSDELREGCVRVASGTIAEVGEGPGPGDRVIDCRGRTVVPGLIDAHFHAYAASLSLLEIETSPQGDVVDPARAEVVLLSDLAALVTLVACPRVRAS